MCPKVKSVRKQKNVENIGTDNNFKKSGKCEKNQKLEYAEMCD